METVIKAYLDDVRNRRGWALMIWDSQTGKQRRLQTQVEQTDLEAAQAQYDTYCQQSPQPEPQPNHVGPSVTYSTSAVRCCTNRHPRICRLAAKRSWAKGSQDSQKEKINA